MKIDGGWKSPDHWANHFKTCPVVRLNGVVIEHVIEADDVEGYVIVQPYQDGKAKLNESGDGFATERRLGRVEIVGERRT